MDAYDELIDELLGTALAPQEMRDLALMQVKDASVQDDAVKDAIRNHQGYEQSQRSALDEYLIAQDQQAKAEAQRAAEMAQQRLNALDNIDSLILTTVGIGKEGKLRLAQNEAERQDIIRAFPQFGARARKEGEGKDKPKEFDLKAMLANKDYSPENIDRLFAENNADLWDEAIRTGDLDLYQAMLDRKLGALPEGLADKMRFVIGGKPETSRNLKLNDKYARLRSVIGETQGDLKDAAKKAAAAAKDKKEKDGLEKDLKDFEREMERALYLLGVNKRLSKDKFGNADFKNKMKALKNNGRIKAEDEAKLMNIIGGF